MSGYWWFGVLALGATGRLTRLVTADTITARLRMRAVRIIGRTSERSAAVATFVTCPWCVSVWIAPAVIALGWWPGHRGTASWWWFPAGLLTIAWFTGLLTSALDND